MPHPTLRFFPLALLLILLVCPPVFSDELDDWIAEGFATIDAVQTLPIARVLTGQDSLDDQPIESRHVFHPDHAPAMDYLVEQMEASGLTASLEPFPCPAPDCANLIVEIPGKTDPATVWIVDAHWDSTNGVDDLAPAPGAVDNASGVIAVLQILAAAAHYEFEQTLRFILFDAEEIGLLGSRYHAKQARQQGQTLEVVLNLDVPGWRMDRFDFAFANSDLPTWPHLQRMMELSELYPSGTGLFGVPLDLIDNSNMGSFWNEGFRGMMIGSLYALTGKMNTARDTLDNLDLEQCTSVAKILFATLATEAGILGPKPDDEPDDDDDNDDNEDSVIEGDDDDRAESDDDSDDGCGC